MRCNTFHGNLLSVTWYVYFDIIIYLYVFVKKMIHLSYLSLQLFHLRQPWHDWLLSWSCRDDCSYQCMWDTVENSYRKNKLPVQQFHGKWPFIRIFGVQEPASAFFSILNLLPHVYMLRKIIQNFTDINSRDFYILSI